MTFLVEYDFIFGFKFYFIFSFKIKKLIFVLKKKLNADMALFKCDVNLFNIILFAI